MYGLVPLHGIDETAFVQIASVRQRTVHNIGEVDSFKRGRFQQLLMPGTRDELASRRTMNNLSMHKNLKLP
jgi:hypothetical protein